MPSVHPSKFAHVVYRTRRFEEMLSWYGQVFGARIQHRNPAMAFLTHDDEHHRFALLDLAVVQPEAAEINGRELVGIDHVAWTYGSLDELFANYTRLKEAGIEPYWCVHHGLTVSMYYADPDGNQMEFQVDAFETPEECNEFIRGPGFAANPVGVEFDPEDWLDQVRKGGHLSDFLKRRVHEPVSPIRGVVGTVM